MSIFNTQEEIRKFTTLDFSRVNSVVLQVNQEVAQFLLSRNIENNRNVSSPRVRAYRQQMKDGDWVLGDPLKFDDKGNLIDGQHRLRAVPPDSTVSFVLLTGLPSKSSETLDQGMKRNALHIAKLRNLNGMTSHSISILRMLFFYRCKGDLVASSNFLTPKKMVDFLEKYPHVFDAINFSLQYSKSHFGTRFGPILAAVARTKLSDYPLSDQDLDYFLFCFQTGKESGYKHLAPRQGEAACVLKSSYNQAKLKKSFGASFRAEMYYQAQSALVAYKEQRPVSHLKKTTKNVFPVPLLDNLNTKTLELDAN